MLSLACNLQFFLLPTAFGAETNDLLHPQEENKNSQELTEDEVSIMQNPPAERFADR